MFKGRAKKAAERKRKSLKKALMRARLKGRKAKEKKEKAAARLRRKKAKRRKAIAKRRIAERREKALAKGKKKKGGKNGCKCPSVNGISSVNGLMREIERLRKQLKMLSSCVDCT